MQTVLAIGAETTIDEYAHSSGAAVNYVSRGSVLVVTGDADAHERAAAAHIAAANAERAAS